MTTSESSPENPTRPENAEFLPRHIAVIMDGNGRWAQKRSLPRVAGHRQGVKSVRAAIEAAGELGIEVLTLFAFSSENWQRPRSEVDRLMELFINSLRDEAPSLNKNGVRMRVVGDLERFSDKLRGEITRVEDLTRDNTGLKLVIAANYGGRWDITQAAKKLARAAAAGSLDPESIAPEHLAAHLALGDLPDPDLFIRSGGERRISNFLLWNLAYTELYFTDTLWPDFNREAFELALAYFRTRQRRFGKTGEQVRRAESA